MLSGSLTKSEAESRRSASVLALEIALSQRGSSVAVMLQTVTAYVEDIDQIRISSCKPLQSCLNPDRLGISRARVAGQARADAPSVKCRGTVPSPHTLEVRLARPLNEDRRLTAAHAGLGRK